MGWIGSNARDYLNSDVGVLLLSSFYGLIYLIYVMILNPGVYFK